MITRDKNGQNNAFVKLISKKTPKALQISIGCFQKSLTYLMVALFEYLQAFL